MRLKNSNTVELDNKDQTDQLYSNMLSGLIITAVAYFVLVALFRGQAPQILVLSLQIVMGVIIIARLADYIYWRKRPTPVSEASSYKRRFKLLAVLTGISWAVAACTLFQYQSLEERYFTLLALGSMTGGAVIVLSGSRLLSIVYPTCLLLPISLMSLISDVNSLSIVGVLGIAYWGIMLNVSRKASIRTEQAVHIKNQQLLLRQQMELERNELAGAYKKLSLANAKLDSVNLDLEEKIESRTADIYRLSNLDPLTGLLNRTALLKTLQQHIKKSPNQSLAAMFIDLNGFKAINDSMGHSIGDQVLSEIANRLQLSTEKDTVSRWGGDEFIVLTEFSSFTATLALAKILLNDISIPIIIDSKVVKLDAAIGISLFPEHDNDAARLIEKADVAMYKNKRERGAGVLFFDKQIQTEVLKEVTLQSGLKQAIANKQFYLVYQPIINAKSNTPWGVEALIRWNFDGKLVRPDEFIPLAEKTGLILEIGQWVLTEACKQMTRWTDTSNGEISVNVSSVQLSSTDFVSVVKQALLASGIAPQKLHLEITETTIMDYRSNVFETIEEIRKLGVSVSIDDFGTGYSSLSQLKHVPANTLKIDRSFVSELAEDDDVIIRAALLIAADYQYQTVAEGVETIEQALYLKNAGIDFIQGFLISKPLLESEIDKWWRANSDTVKYDSIPFDERLA